MSWRIFRLLGILGLVTALGWHFQGVLKAQDDIAPRTPEEQRVIDVYKLANEAVAFITTTSVTFDLFSGIQGQEGTGSGVVVDEKYGKGIILTNYHVIQSADKISVTLWNGMDYRASLVGLDPEDDLAVLKLNDPPKNLRGLSFADSNKLEVGQRVIAIGNPFGLNRTLTTGVISSLNRTVKSPTGFLMKGLIQTDAAINPGNSGGPLIDTAGRLIGLNTAILSRSGDSAGIGFAAPVNQIKRVLPELIATGKVLRADLGWILVDTDQGPFVYRVFPDGPAEAAGIKSVLKRVENAFVSGYIRDFERADLVYSINGQRVANKEQAEDIIVGLDTSKSVLVELRRGGGEGPSRKVEIKPVLR